MNDFWNYERRISPEEEFSKALDEMMVKALETGAAPKLILPDGVSEPVWVNPAVAEQHLKMDDLIKLREELTSRRPTPEIQRLQDEVNHLRELIDRRNLADCSIVKVKPEAVDAANDMAAAWGKFRRGVATHADWQAMNDAVDRFVESSDLQNEVGTAEIVQQMIRVMEETSD